MPVSYFQIRGRWYTNTELSVATCLDTLRKLCGEDSPTYRTFAEGSRHPSFGAGETLVTLAEKFHAALVNEEAQTKLGATTALAQTSFGAYTTLTGSTAGVRVFHKLFTDQLTRDGLPGPPESWPALDTLHANRMDVLANEENIWRTITAGRTHRDYLSDVWNYRCDRLECTVARALEDGVIIGSEELPPQVGVGMPCSTMEDLRGLAVMGIESLRSVPPVYELPPLRPAPETLATDSQPYGWW